QHGVVSTFGAEENNAAAGFADELQGLVLEFCHRIYPGHSPPPHFFRLDQVGKFYHSLFRHEKIIVVKFYGVRSPSVLNVFNVAIDLLSGLSLPPGFEDGHNRAERTGKGAANARMIGEGLSSQES